MKKDELRKAMAMHVPCKPMLGMPPTFHRQIIVKVTGDVLGLKFTTLECKKMKGELVISENIQQMKNLGQEG